LQLYAPDGLEEKTILLYDNAHPHAADMTVTLGSQSHSPYNPDLPHSDFNLFGPMKVHLGEQQF
jgi:hypothetical protein